MNDALTVITIVSDTNEMFKTGDIEPKHLRSHIIKCLTNFYNRKGIPNKPTQAEISKSLKKIKNEEAPEYFKQGYIMININEVHKGGKQTTYVCSL